MTGYIDKNGHAIPMPSVDFGNNIKATEKYRNEWITKYENMGYEIIH